MNILATKLHIPPLRSSIVPRPRLLELLSSGIHEQRKLTLICAPAGYGKTTLVTDWLHAHAHHSQGEGIAAKVSYLALDQADNDLARFICYWLAAFQQINPAVGQETQALLDGPQLPPVHAVLDQLINDLAALETPILLAVDDYHLIHNPQVHEALEYFLDHQPLQVHLILLSRSDPPLPVARLRASGQLTEIRANTLRFTHEEGRQFFDLSFDSPLDGQTLQVLGERTEGWAAGLHLAALALQRQPNPAAFVETFRGSHRYVLDYLAEEVLRQQDQSVRDFLTKTSILDRFNAEACNFLIDQTNSQSLIFALDQSNMFIMPLDDERIWYRYHHLFSDYLRSLLSKSETTALCQKASAWHEASGLVEESIRYALASGDWEFAAALIERALNKDQTWSGGNLTLWLSWLESLPQQIFQNYPALSLHTSRILYLSGRFNQAETKITQAEQSLKSRPVTPETEILLALAALYRGSIASVRGDFKMTIEQTMFAQARLPGEYHLAHARAYFSLGLAYEFADQTGLAVENFIKSSREAEAAGVLFLEVHALCAAAQVQIKQGRMHLAERTCQSALDQAHGSQIAPLGLAWIILGGIELERNHLQAADKLLEDGIVLARRGGLLDDLALGLGFLARLRLYQNEIPAALAALHEVHDLLRSFGIPRLELLAGAHLARVQLYLGQVREAAHWAANYQHDPAASPRDFEDLTLVRFLLATGELDTIPAILHPVLEKANAAGRMQTSIEAMLLLARYHAARHEMDSALAWIGRSLKLAAPEGFTRFFLDEGKAVVPLLSNARSAAPEFVDSLLGFSRAAAGSLSASPPTPLDSLPEPLSEQELRVLRLIAAGKSNKEIAGELVITLGTAKWHVHNVLQKLGVSNRPQAIVRARELGVDPI